MIILWDKEQIKLKDVVLVADVAPKYLSKKIKNNYLNNNYGFVICDFNNFSDPYDFFLKTSENLKEFENFTVVRLLEDSKKENFYVLYLQLTFILVCK